MVPSWAPSCPASPRCSREVWELGHEGAPSWTAGTRRRGQRPPRDPGGRSLPRRSWAKDLDAATLYELLKLRVEVFVVEQAMPVSGTGRARSAGRDAATSGWRDLTATSSATLRLMEEHPGGEKAFRIGRVRTKRAARGHGHTARLLQAALAEVGDYPCHINAQTYLEEMYAKHGFVRDGDEFLDDGIPHVPMMQRRERDGSRERGLPVQRDRRPGPTAPARWCCVRCAPRSAGC